MCAWLFTSKQFIIVSLSFRGYEKQYESQNFFQIIYAPYFSILHIPTTPLHHLPNLLKTLLVYSWFVFSSQLKMGEPPSLFIEPSTLFLSDLFFFTHGPQMYLQREVNQFQPWMPSHVKTKPLFSPSIGFASINLGACYFFLSSETKKEKHRFKRLKYKK